MSRGRGSGAAWLAAAATAVLLWLWVAEPTFGILSAAFTDDAGALSLSRWQTLGALRESVLATVLVVAGSVLGAVAVGLPLALAIATLEFPGRRWLAGLLVLPVTLPPLVGTLAVYKLAGPLGMLPGLLAAAGWGDPPHLHSWAGVLAVHTLTMYPIVFVFCLAALARLDGSRIEAARVHGAPLLEVLWRVLLPALRPALAASSALVAMTSLASFSAPLYFLQADEQYLTLTIFRTRESDPARSILGTFLLFLAALLILALFVWLEGRTAPPLSRGAPRPLAPRRRHRAGGRIAVLALYGFTGLVLLPQVAVAHLALAEGWGHTEPVPLRLTGRHLMALIHDPELTRPIVTSFLLSLAAVAVAAVLGLTAAWWRRRTRIPGRAMVEACCMLPFALPGTVLALALLRHCNRPWGLGLLPPVADTIILLPLAYAVRVLPLCYRGASAGLAAQDRAPEEAAATLGAGAASRWRRVVMPAIAPAVGAAALLAFLTALGEFPASILLAVPEAIPVSVKINTLMRHETCGPPFALGVCLIVVQVLVVAVAARLAAPRRLAYDPGPR
jgi:iron(III) transport system permease protein